MGNWLNKMEQKFGRYAIPNLTTLIIFTYVIGYALRFIGFTGFITFNPYLIMHGQVWRIISWIFIPRYELDIFSLIMIFFYYWIGTSLERVWGDFRYNVYVFSGILFTIVGAFAVYLFGSSGGNDYMGLIFGSAISNYVSTYYITMSLPLAFAATYPDVEIMFQFIFPLKMKYVALIDIAFIIYDAYRYPWFAKVIIFISMLNFVLFWLSTKNISVAGFKQQQRKSSYMNAARRGKREGSYQSSDGRITKHKCAVCGRTELDDPMLEFRFCSKCNGNYEYCQDHLFTHTHK